MSTRVRRRVRYLEWPPYLADSLREQGRLAMQVGDLPSSARSRLHSRRPASPDAYPISRADTVQLVADGETYRVLEQLVGEDVTVRGSLFARHTGHHHAPLLLVVVAAPNDVQPMVRSVRQPPK